ncbi:sensor histidine kinase [Scatolibacter rhodanostii]|uniref:sensor histidine kinase n=1 Tax=Scatolibacter rhodanostii TaxID=2014781 RepID=UPI000C068887|nr:HAMP domain-containing sensor histidine kinase [Scatolibacter rhodanostii]
MATKLKNTKLPVNLFVGLISWVAFLSLIYAFSCIVTAMVLVLFQSDLSGSIKEVLYLFPHFHKIPQEILIRLISIIFLVLLSLVLTMLFRKERKQFEVLLTHFLAKVWIEFKIMFYPLIIYLAILPNIFWLLLLAIILVIYLVCLDIGYNRSIFRRNIASSILHAFNKAKKGSTYEYIAIRRMISVISIISGIIILDALVISVVNFLRENYVRNTSRFDLIIPSIIFISLSGIIGSLAWYYLSHKKDLEDLSNIMVQIEKMYSGNLNAVNSISPASQFYDMAMQLNMIRTGIERAVDEGIKANKTKVELITNVSHDIKTPLTSIISYIELLKKEEGLPEHVQDYVQTLSNKATRLSHIVQDVFEVSKAATGNLSLNVEPLDLSKLLQQTLAETEECMNKVQLDWRIDIADEALMIQTDGQKMYRVFQNLIRNAAQYSLEGSRVYMSLKKVNRFAEFSLRNVAKAELDSSAAEYLTGRFIRGDQNRTTEGSGLGLSIAKSFTEACGGKFVLKIDEDIFLVKVIFELETPLETFSQTFEPVILPHEFASPAEELSLTEDSETAQPDAELKPESSPSDDNS